MKKALLVLVLLVVFVSPVMAQPECPPPGAIDLVYFRAVPRGGATVLEWETAQEIDNIGFNLYKASDLHGIRKKVNRELIPARNPGSVIGGFYFFIDGMQPGRYYWLEDIDANGVSTFHGPTSLRRRIILVRPRLRILRSLDG